MHHFHIRNTSKIITNFKFSLFDKNVPSCFHTLYPISSEEWSVNKELIVNVMGQQVCNFHTYNYRGVTYCHIYLGKIMMFINATMNLTICIIHADVLQKDVLQKDVLQKCAPKKSPMRNLTEVSIYRIDLKSCSKTAEESLEMQVTFGQPDFTDANLVAAPASLSPHIAVHDAECSLMPSVPTVNVNTCSPAENSKSEQLGENTSKCYHHVILGNDCVWLFGLQVRHSKMFFFLCNTKRMMYKVHAAKSENPSCLECLTYV